MIPYPAINPVAVELGPIAVRWYGLAYIAGITIGWLYCRRLAKQPPTIVEPETLDDFIIWATIGVILGGRLGYVLFYQPSHYFAHPLQIFYVWEGGMSFHGGALGVAAALTLFSWRRHVPLLRLSDIIACGAPIGLFFGRIANFINGELWGRATDVPWAMIFPSDPDHLPRHPSQLYEAGLEGVVLFLLLFVLLRVTRIREHAGALTGAFLMGYAVARSVGELFRQPDAFLGFILPGVTMGQLLSLPLLVVGLLLLLRAYRKSNWADKKAPLGDFAGEGGEVSRLLTFHERETPMFTAQCAMICPPDRRLKCLAGENRELRRG